MNNQACGRCSILAIFIGRWPLPFPRIIVQEHEGGIGSRD